jgi:DNA-directed RNA polymerase subunit RPC12/RpoP
MLIELKAKVSLSYTCYKCKKEILTFISLIELNKLEDFRSQVMGTLNVEGHDIRNNSIWICPTCRK